MFLYKIDTLNFDFATVDKVLKVLRVLKVSRVCKLTFISSLSQIELMGHSDIIRTPTYIGTYKKPLAPLEPLEPSEPCKH